VVGRLRLALVPAVLLLAAHGAARGIAPVDGPPAYAIRCAKVFTVDDEDRIFAPGMLLIEGGKIAYAGAPMDVPSGYELLEYPHGWAIPGMIDLHTHIHSGGWGDINDMVLPINTDLRAGSAFRPANELVARACASGVTTLFGIPGSGTSISGFGILYKAKPRGNYAGSMFADPGGMKVAQTHNPERRAGDLGATRAGLSWMLEDVNDKARAATRQGRDELALRNIRKVHARELPVLIHCAGNDGVAGAARMWRRNYATRSVLSHGCFDGWYAAGFVAASGMPVNLGPRVMNWSYGMREGRIVGTADEYLKAGVSNVSLNTDSGVIEQEMFFLQGAVSARLGADAYQMLRAVTINPARAFGIDDRLGSLEVGKDADVVLKNGDALDPRVRVELVIIDGEIQYDPARQGQHF
jgi:imidazolonepropionase-like amidohydrolase